jgi:hypothetical protein
MIVLFILYKASLKTLLFDSLNPFPSPKEKGKQSF